MLIEYGASFTGQEFTGPGWLYVTGERISEIGTGPSVRPPDLRCGLLLPGLIDAHAVVYGYAERLPETDPFAAHVAALRLHLSCGVTTVRDPGNSMEALLHLRRVAEASGGPRLFASGPVLDGLPLARPASRLVLDRADVKRTMAVLRAEGVDFVSLGRYLDPEFATEAIGEARAAELPTAAETTLEGLAALAAAGVASVEYLPRLLDPFAAPLDQLLEWASHPDPVLDAALDVLAEHRMAVCPMLVATRRRVLLREVVNEPMLEAAVPMLQYYRHLVSMRGSVGYAIGRKYLRQHIEFPSLDRRQHELVAESADRIGNWLVAAGERGVAVLAGSGCPAVGTVPGHGLLRELQQLSAAGLTATDVLAAATSRPAAVLGRPDLGSIAVGATADLLLTETDPADVPSGLERSAPRTMVGGRLIDADSIGAHPFDGLPPREEK